ncbi:MAG: hypothetical protein ACRCT1_07155 [Microcoleaceae cyanobacterium]
MKPEILIERLNTVPGFKLALWEKHGMKRIYLNRINGVITSAYLEIDENNEMKMGKYLSPLSLSELIDLAKSISNDEVQPPEDEPRIVRRGAWEYIGNGKIRAIYYSNGKEDFETQGEISQADLDDFWG